MAYTDWQLNPPPPSHSALRPMDPSGLISPMAPRFGKIPLPDRRGSGGGGTSHRRSFSETFAFLPDVIAHDPEPDFDLSDIDFSSLSGEGCGKGMEAEASRPEPSATVGRPVPGAHLRSLSVDAAFFEGVLLQSMDEVGVEAERRGGHQRSGSMDGANTPFAGGSEFPQPELANKAMPADKLAELALIDPKRAKKILANRQSAVRSKERKIRYTSELERKFQTLQIEATSLSAQLTLLQRSTTGLTVENRELKLRLQAMEQHAELHEALNEALREEVQRLKSATGEIPIGNGNPFSFSNQQTAPGRHCHSHRLRHSSKQAQHLQGSEAQACSKN